MLKNGMRKLSIIFFAAFLMCAAFFLASQAVTYADTADSAFESEMTAQGFPESYKPYLRMLHFQHPTWHFKAKNLGFTWNEALTKQYAGSNTVATSYPDAFKAVKSGTYNFSTHTYYAKDGASWVAASKQAVAFYMDPRNWLTEDSVFMFENNAYDASYQTEDIVKKIISSMAMPAEASAYYMEAAQQSYNGKSYSVSPIYLASKSRVELGTSDFMVNGHSFTYGSNTYSGLYNAYNIGASDSADGSAATKGLVFAGGGSDPANLSTTYNRPWNTLEKAITGGALYIAEDFVANGQNTLYYERFNVGNGITSVGTHQYQTAVFGAATQAGLIQNNYQLFDILGDSFTFEIPVYSDLPTEACPRPPSTGNNDCYLDSITVSANGTDYTFTPAFNRFTSTYTLSQDLPADVSSVTVTTVKNSDDSTVTVTGANNLKYGQNKITVRCKASSGLVSKYYYINLNSTRPTNYVPEVPSNVKAENKSANVVDLSWTGDSTATGYRIRYRRSGTEKWYYNETTGTTYEKTMASKGVAYDFKVRAFYVGNDGKRTYSKDYSETVRAASFDEMPELTGCLYGGYMTVKGDWTAVQGATGYTVSWRLSNTEDWTEADVTENTFVQKMPRAGMGFEIKVTPYIEMDGVKYLSGTPTNTITVYTLKKTTLTAATKYNKCVALNWVNISGETGYDIWRSTSPDTGFRRIIKPSATRSYWLDQYLTPGTTYYYKIRAYRNTAPGVYVYGPFSSVVSVTR